MVRQSSRRRRPLCNGLSVVLFLFFSYECSSFTAISIAKKESNFPPRLALLSKTPRTRCSTTLPSSSIATFEGEPSPETEDNSFYSSVKTVAVVGSGAVGCYYGARLWEIGHRVMFYMRTGEHYDACSTNGLNVTSYDGDLFIDPDELELYDSTEQMGTVDWVIVAVKSYSLDDIPDLIYPLLDPERTRVLVIMNGLIEDDLIQQLKIRAGERGDMDAPVQCCHTLYGGMALLCSNRISPGHIDHSYAGMLSAGVASTQSVDDPTMDQQAFEELWQYSKIPISYEPCLLKGRWRKMIWNLAFNGLSTAMGGWTVDRIVTDPSLRRLADVIMDETIVAGNADLERKYGPGNYDPLVPEDKKPMMKLSDDMGPYKTSTMLDLTNRRPMEVKYLFQVPMSRARQLGVPALHLETVVAQIEALQRHYGL